MAGAGGNVVAIGRVLLRADTKGLAGDLREAEGQVKRAGVSMGSVLQAGAVAGTAALAGLAVGAKKAGEAAIDAETSQRKLEAQLKALGLSYQTHGKQIEETIAKQSKLAALDDEDLAESFTNLVRTTGDVTEALRLNGIAADIARAKGISLEAASKLLQKAYMGSDGAAKRLGVSVQGLTKDMSDQEKGQKIVAELQKTFAGQAESYGDSAAGAQDRVKVSVENLMEALGKGLLPIVASVAGTFADLVGWLEEHSGAAKVGIGVVAGLSAAFIAANAAMRIHASVTRASAAAQALLNAVMRANPFVLIATLIIALGAAIVVAYKKSETFRRIVQAVFDAVKKAGQAMWDALKAAFNFFRDKLGAVADAARDFGSKVKGAFSAVKDWVRGHWPEIATLLSGPFALILAPATNAFGIRSRMKTAFTEVKDWAKEKVDQVVGFFTGIPGRVVNLGTSLANVLRGAFKTGINAIISVINFIKIPSKHIHIGVPGPDWLTGPDIDFTFPEIDPFPDIAPLKSGGVIDVGRRDRDSVPALLSRGEMVLNESQQERLGGGALLQRLLGLPIIRRGGPVQLASGGWVYPLASKGSIIGTPYGGTHTLGNWPSDNAVDIGVPVGTPVVAVASGTLSGASYGGPGSSRFGGWGIYLATPQGTVWYKHLTSLTRQGGTVAKGEVIGTSGAGNGVPHIHFAAQPPTSPYAMANAPLRSAAAAPSPATPTVASGTANASGRDVTNKAAAAKYEKLVQSGRAFRWGGLYWGPGVTGGGLANFLGWLREHGTSIAKFRQQHPEYASLLEHGTTIPAGKRQSQPGEGVVKDGQPTDGGDVVDDGGLLDDIPADDELPADMGGVPADTGGGDTGGGTSGPTQGEIEAQIQERLSKEAEAIWGARQRFYSEFAPNVFRATPSGMVPGSTGPLRNVTVIQQFNRPVDDQFTLLRRAEFAAAAAF